MVHTRTRIYVNTKLRVEGSSVSLQASIYYKEKRNKESFDLIGTKHSDVRTCTTDLQK